MSPCAVAVTTLWPIRALVDAIGTRVGKTWHTPREGPKRNVRPSGPHKQKNCYMFDDDYDNTADNTTDNTNDTTDNTTDNTNDTTDNSESKEHIVYDDRVRDGQ